jgi:hypothetical protein
MSALHPSSIRPFLIFRPRHHVFPNVSSSKLKAALLPNDVVLPTAGIFTECFEENFLPNGVYLPNSAHKSVSFMYQFLVLTPGSASLIVAARREDGGGMGPVGSLDLPSIYSPSRTPPTSSNPEWWIPGRRRPSSRAHASARLLLQAPCIDLDDLLHLGGGGISREWCGL